MLQTFSIIEGFSISNIYSLFLISQTCIYLSEVVNVTVLPFTFIDTPSNGITPFFFLKNNTLFLIHSIYRLGGIHNHTFSLVIISFVG